MEPSVVEMSHSGSPLAVVIPVVVLIVMMLLRLRADVEVVEALLLALISMKEPKISLFIILAIKLCISLVSSLICQGDQISPIVFRLLYDNPQRPFEPRISVGAHTFGWLEDDDILPGYSFALLPKSPGVITHVRHISIVCGFGPATKILVDDSTPLALVNAISVYPHLASAEFSHTPFLPLLSLYCLRWELWVAFTGSFFVSFGTAHCGRLLEWVLCVLFAIDLLRINQKRYCASKTADVSGVRLVGEFVVFGGVLLVFHTFSDLIPPIFFHQVVQYLIFITLCGACLFVLNMKRCDKLST